MAAAWAPDRGEVVWLQFNPQSGHEQAGHRPALTISPRAYNQKAGLGLFCPVTTRIKGYPYEVVLPDGIEASGAILADQIKSLDWRARGAELLCPVPGEVVAEVLAKVLTLVGADLTT